jgi:dynein heavy chain
MTNMLFADF